MNDNKLLHLLKSGEEYGVNKAIQYIYQKYAASLPVYVQQNGGSAAIAGDLFQEAVISFYQHVKEGRFLEQSSIRQYLFAIVRNNWLYHLRKEKHSPIESDVSLSMLTQITSSGLEVTKEATAVGQLLSQMDCDCQKLIQLYYFNQYDLQEISNIFGLGGCDSAKTKKYRCVKRLKELCKSGNITRARLAG